MRVLFKDVALNKKGLVDFVKQFIKFGIVGLSNTAISYGIYYAMILVNTELYLLANVIGFVASVINAYFWNNRVVFAKGKKTFQEHAKSLAKTFAAYGSTALLSTILLVVLVQLFGISEFLAPLLILVITVPLNFLINKFWTFKK